MKIHLHLLHRLRLDLHHRHAIRREASHLVASSGHLLPIHLHDLLHLILRVGALPTVGAFGRAVVFDHADRSSGGVGVGDVGGHAARARDGERSIDGHTDAHRGHGAGAHPGACGRAAAGAVGAGVRVGAGAGDGVDGP